VRREVVFYRTESGRSPVEDFIDSLSAKRAQKVIWVLRLIEDLETVPVQYFKKMTGTDQLWEVRVKVGTDTYRLVGFHDGRRLVVMAHAFQKKTRKIPRQVIRVAEARRRDYFNRRKGI